MSESGRKWGKGVVILGITGAVVGGLYAVATPFVLPAFRRVCLPYVPATTAQVNNVFSVIERAAGAALISNETAVYGNGPGEKLTEQGRLSGNGRISQQHDNMKVNKVLVDLGSGDGRIVIEAARRGFHGVGYELNPWLVWYSRLTARQAGVHHMTSFERTNLWKVDLNPFDVIVIFGVSQMMDALQVKIAEEVKGSGCVVACRFPLPEWEPQLAHGEGVDEVWLYTASPKNEGAVAQNESR